MAQLVTINGQEGQYCLVRKGTKNTRIRPVAGGEDFLAPTETLTFTETVIPDVPKTPSVPQPIAPAVVKVQIPEEPIVPVEIPTSTAPYWVLHYTREEVKLFEFFEKSEAASFLQPYLTLEGVLEFGDSTFKESPNSLYELHNFTLSDVKELSPCHQG